MWERDHYVQEINRHTSLYVAWFFLYSVRSANYKYRAKQETVTGKQGDRSLQREGDRETVGVKGCGDVGQLPTGSPSFCTAKVLIKK